MYISYLITGTKGAMFSRHTVFIIFNAVDIEFKNQFAAAGLDMGTNIVPASIPSCTCSCFVARGGGFRSELATVSGLGSSERFFTGRG